jgi:hypothetical protein
MNAYSKRVGRAGLAGGAARVLAGISGVLVVSLAVALAAGCGGNSYRSDATAIASELQEATETAVASLQGVADEPTDDPQADLEQAELVRDQSALWATSVSEALAGFQELDPPENARLLHSDYLSFLEAYGTAIDRLSGIADYSVGVLTASSDLTAAAADDGPFGQLSALIAAGSSDVEAQAALLDSGSAVVEDFLSKWEAISAPEDFADIHGMITTDVGTALTIIQEVLAQVEGAGEDGSGGDEAVFQSLAADFGAQWATVQQDFEGWNAVHLSLRNDWLDV